MAASCARHLRAAGVSAGDRVALCMENRPEFPVAEVALMAIRAVPVAGLYHQHGGRSGASAARLRGSSGDRFVQHSDGPVDRGGGEGVRP